MEGFRGLPWSGLGWQNFYSGLVSGAIKI
jgi:hypothetical protein